MTYKVHSRLLEQSAPVKEHVPVKYTDNKILNALLNDVRSMPKAKIQSLTYGVRGIHNFLDGDGFIAFKGGMQVKAETAASQKSLMLGMNVMRWLTKFYFKDTVQGFGTLYRLHSTKDDSLREGSVYSFTPRKPMLSWTILENPRVGDREATHAVHDYLITSKFDKADIIWSYKIAKYKLDIIKAMNDYDRCINSKNVKYRDDSQEATLTLGFMDRLSKAVKWMLLDEQEVVVFNDMKPFKAKVLRKL